MVSLPLLALALCTSIGLASDEFLQGIEWGSYDVDALMNVQTRNGLRAGVGWGGYDSLRYFKTENTSDLQWDVFDGIRQMGHAMMTDKKYNLNIDYYFLKDNKTSPSSRDQSRVIFSRMVFSSREVEDMKDDPPKDWRELAMATVETLPISAFVGIPNKGPNASIRILPWASNRSTTSNPKFGFNKDGDEPLWWCLKSVDHYNRTAITVLQIKWIHRDNDADSWLKATEKICTPPIIVHQISDIELNRTNYEDFFKNRRSSRLFRSTSTPQQIENLQKAAKLYNIDITDLQENYSTYVNTYKGLPQKSGTYAGSLGRTALLNAACERPSNSTSGIAFDIHIYTNNKNLSTIDSITGCQETVTASTPTTTIHPQQKIPSTILASIKLLNNSIYISAVPIPIISAIEPHWATVLLSHNFKEIPADEAIHAIATIIASTSAWLSTCEYSLRPFASQCSAGYPDPALFLHWLLSLRSAITETRSAVHAELLVGEMIDGLCHSGLLNDEVECAGWLSTTSELVQRILQASATESHLNQVEERLLSNLYLLGHANLLCNVDGFDAVTKVLYRQLKAPINFQEAMQKKMWVSWVALANSARHSQLEKVYDHLSSIMLKEGSVQYSGVTTQEWAAFIHGSRGAR